MSTALLVVGYPVAAWGGAGLWPAWRDRELRRFLAFEAGTACVTAGLVLKRKRIPAFLNGATLVGVGVLWGATGRFGR